MSEKNQNFYHIEFFLKNKCRETEKHISHVCHDKRCFNTNHLYLETAKKNSSRNGCKRILEELRRNKKKMKNKTQLFHIKCKHDPKCFLSVRQTCLPNFTLPQRRDERIFFFLRFFKKFVKATMFTSVYPLSPLSPLIPPHTHNKKNVLLNI